MSNSIAPLRFHRRSTAHSDALYAIPPQREALDQNEDQQVEAADEQADRG